MTLSEYFESAKGTGVLATANASGEVDAALYGRPHVIDDRTIAFIMADRLSHQNLQSNSHATYLFVERGEGYKGKRLYLTKIAEETIPRRFRPYGGARCRPNAASRPSPGSWCISAWITCGPWWRHAGGMNAAVPGNLAIGTSDFRGDDVDAIVIAAGMGLLFAGCTTQPWQRAGRNLRRPRSPKRP